MKKLIILMILTLFAFVSYGQLRIVKGLYLGPKSSSTVVKIDSISYVGGLLKIYKGSTNVLTGIITDSTTFATQYDLTNAISTTLEDADDLNTALEALDYMKLPVLTQTAINALTPATGMFVFNSTTGKINYYSSGAWRSIAIE